jgi:pimeloyl-ACP methyl ester carboxylesterase
MKPFALEDQAIAVRVEGEGRPVVLLHGLGADSSQVLAALPAPTGHRCIYPDMPGHGVTPSGKAGFRQFADLVRALLDQMGIERAVLGGISMGAAISLRLALDAPDRVLGLMLIRPSWLDRPALPHLGIIDRVSRWQLQAPREASARLEEDAEFQVIERANPAAAQSVRGLLTRRQAHEGAAVLGAMVSDRPFHRLGELAAITCKCLVVANDDDPLHPVRIAREIADRLPDARLHLVPSRYRSPAEHFAALQAAVRQFLNQLGEL